ncbi:unnamed protein product [Hyaloperonospora brassicae]|uniref:RxLR effector protein n=1 Tax=Hyaloperonospora brassicae TaxID=162125 RepID=A0AAV0TNK1_HYABA|nr:unnamed protein product [Hyaloperonospora brassicae]
MVRSLVQNAGYAKSARMLQAVVSEGKSTREANELLSALLTKWVQNSNSLHDVLIEQFKLGAGLDEMFKDPGLILVADRFISAFNFLKQAHYPNMLNQLTVHNGEEEVAKLVASLDQLNPLIEQWKGRQFPIWLRAGKEPSVVKELLKTDPDPTKNSAAVGIYRSYKKEFERQTTARS